MKGGILNVESCATRFLSMEASLVGDSKCGRKYRQTAQTASMKLEIDGINGFIPLPSEEELEVDRICETDESEKGCEIIRINWKVTSVFESGS